LYINTTINDEALVGLQFGELGESKKFLPNFNSPISYFYTIIHQAQAPPNFVINGWFHLYDIGGTQLTGGWFHLYDIGGTQLTGVWFHLYDIGGTQLTGDNVPH